MSKFGDWLVRRYLAELGVEHAPDSILFRMRGGSPYGESRLGADYAAVRLASAPGDVRQSRDMRRSGVLEAFAGVGFAPTTFGAHAGDLFVSDVASGNLYVLDAAGDASLFASLPLPVGFTEPGLRQFAWAPTGFTLPDGEDLGGDLFVSIAAQNGGGGSSGEIDVLNAAGDTVAHYLEGGGEAPLDPRGLLFIDPTTLLVANADPGIQELGPRDFVGGSPAPEPSTWAMMLIGFAGLGFAGYRRTRVAVSAA
jgi:hypothetical protein